jgi:hypothetical protein
MQEPGLSTKRVSIEYFEGINSATQPNLVKKTELGHSENARTGLVGSLYKRAGQTAVGTNAVGGEFLATANSALFYFDNADATASGIYRISNTSAESGNQVSIFKLTTGQIWERLSDSSAVNIPPGDFDHANANGQMILVNGSSSNRMIMQNGTTVTDSTEAGSLFNSPNANRAAFYKNRIYLADFTSGGIRYKNTVIRSSYPVGIISLVNGDMNASSTSVPVTDSKYFYTATGMNSYEVYRGGTLVTTMTVTAIQETSITVQAPVQLLSSDEIWAGGTFTGEKQYRWINNPTAIGRDVKQYDTFKLSGGDEDAITMMETIGNNLFIANKNALMSWDDYTLTNSDTGIGCISTKGYVKLLGTLFFMHYSGVYSTSGSQPVLVSRKIDRYIKGATKQGLESCSAGFKDFSIFFSIGDSTLYYEDGSVQKVLKNVCLEFNTVDSNWFVHTNVPATEFANFQDTNGNRLFMAHGGTGSKVKAFLEGETDDGEEIFMRVDTREIQMQREVEGISSPHAVVADIPRGSHIRCFLSLDGDPFYELEGTFEKGISTIKITSKNEDAESTVKCHKAIISIRDSSKQLCGINQLDLLYTMTPFEKSQ